jgi:hypothetical protein
LKYGFQLASFSLLFPAAISLALLSNAEDGPESFADICQLRFLWMGESALLRVDVGVYID